MHVTTSADGATKAGGNLVIAQIDMRAATRTVGRCRLIADFVLSFAFETRNDAITLATPNILELAMERNFSRGNAFLGDFDGRLRRHGRERAAALPANRRL